MRKFANRMAARYLAAIVVTVIISIVFVGLAIHFARRADEAVKTVLAPGIKQVQALRELPRELRRSTTNNKPE